MNLRPRRRPVPTIPIVSLIDIMVILLIFFIATTTFKKQKVEVKITLPESKALGGATSAPEARTTITVTKEQKLFLDAKPVELDKLATALISLKEAKPDAKLGTPSARPATRSTTCRRESSGRRGSEEGFKLGEPET